MLKKYLICSVLIGSFWGCNLKEKMPSDLPTIFINLDELPPISFKELFSAIELIPLATSDSTLLGITYPLFTTSYYFMRDNTQQQLVVFDSTGNFVFKIYNQGSGPQQYRNMNQIAYNPFSHELYIIELPNTVHKYDSTGHFLEKKTVPFSHIGDLVPLNYDTLLISNGNGFMNHNLYSFGNNKMMSHLDDSAYYLGSNNFYYYNRDLFHFKWYDNIIYKVNEQGIKPCYQLDFGKYNRTNDALETIFKQMYQNRYNEDKSIAIMDHYFPILIDKVQENSKYIFINIKNVHDGFKRLYLIYNKEKEKVFVFDPTKEGVVWDSWNDCLFEDCYITCMDAYQKDALECRLLSPSNKTIYDNISDDANPIIIKYKLK